VKLHWLIPSTVGTIFMLSSPTLAARLDSWRFDANQNRLEINTNGGVQPKAQLIFSPTRLVIDLPGTRFGQRQLTRPVGGAIRSVRVGQLDEDTTRFVVELAPGYTLDPNQIKFQGLSDHRWIVQLPTPQLENTSSSPNNSDNVVNITAKPANPNNIRPDTKAGNNLITSNNSIPNNNSITSSNSIGITQIEGFRVTGDGFFIRTNAANGVNPPVQINRSLDGKTIFFDIAGANLSSNFPSRQASVDRFGVNRVEFTPLQRTPSAVRMTLRVDQDSPNWRVISSNGGLVVIPNRNVVRLPDSRGNNNNDNNNVTVPTSPINENPTPVANNSLANIESVELSSGGTQLTIRTSQNQGISVNSAWDRASGLYRITVNSAQLSGAVKGPSLDANSPILRVALKQQDPRTVVISVQPAAGVQIGRINQIGSQLLALPLQRTRPPLISPIALPFPSTSNPQSQETFPAPGNNNPQPGRKPMPAGRVIIVVDPGHGGKDSGAPGIGGLLEKDVVLPISQRIAATLQQNGVNVVLTRDSDYFVELQGRVDIAERSRANLFVSIHANSIDNRSDVNGLETYYYGSGYGLAQAVHSTILQNIGSIKDRGVRKARFYVLRKNSMPAILVETGYMTGREDNPKLGNKDYQNRMADAIARGIIKYLQR
jgi:N-acetylmuramoyl-L-alanine amidase